MTPSISFKESQRSVTRFLRVAFPRHEPYGFPCDIPVCFDGLWPIGDCHVDSISRSAAKRRLSLAAYAREVLVREAARATMEETLVGPRKIAGRRLTARQLKQLVRAGRP